jgi:hypothetical protein
LTLLEGGDTVICISKNQVTVLNLLYNEYERLSEVETIYADALDSCIAIKYLVQSQKLTIDTLITDFEKYKELQKEEHQRKDREITRLKSQNKRNFLIFGAATLTLLGALLISLTK